MKILKPGKVEQRKFVCPQCGCVFVAKPSDIVMHPFDDDEEWAECPECSFHQWWNNGEPYEEPTQEKQSKKDTPAMDADIIKAAAFILFFKDYFFGDNDDPCVTFREE